MNWPRPQLQEFCRIVQGGRSGLSGNDFVPEGVPAYGAGGLNGYLPRHEFDEPAVILSSIGARCGKCFYATGKWASLANTQLIFPDPTKADVRFLWIQLNDESRWHRSGTGQPFIKPSDVKTHRVLLPPLPEQRRIAEVLDRAEALRAKRRAALAQLDSLTQAIFIEMFGDPITNPKAWPKRILGEIAREKPNNGIFRKNPEYIQEGKSGLPVVWVEELFRGESIDTNDSRRVIPTDSDLEKYGLKTGDILFCRSSLKLDGIAFNNVYLGKADEALFECHVIRISPDLKIVSPVFLNTLLRLPQMRAVAKSKSKTATMTTIDQQSLCSIEVPLPPVTLQEGFADRVRAVQKVKVSNRASVAELDALFATLQSRAFNGTL